MDKKPKKIKKPLRVIEQLEAHIKKHPKHKRYILYCYCCKDYIT